MAFFGSVGAGVQGRKRRGDETGFDDDAGRVVGGVLRALAMGFADPRAVQIGMQRRAMEEKFAREDQERWGETLQEIDFLAGLEKSGMPAEQIAIIRQNPEKFSEEFAKRYGAFNMDEGNTLATMGLDGTYNTLTAPKTFQEGADVVQTTPQTFTIPPNRTQGGAQGMGQVSMANVRGNGSIAADGLPLAGPRMSVGAYGFDNGEVEPMGAAGPGFSPPPGFSPSGGAQPGFVAGAFQPQGRSMPPMPGGVRPGLLADAINITGLRPIPEQYADSLGLERGSAEWANAVRDYALKEYGPTAVGSKREIENIRQSGLNKRHSTPKPTKAPAPKDPTEATVVGRILDKQARGVPLTSSEEHVLSAHYERRGRGGRNRPRPTGGGAAPRPAPDGAIRVNPTTGRRERKVRGQWVAMR